MSIDELSRIRFHSGDGLCPVLLCSLRVARDALWSAVLAVAILLCCVPRSVVAAPITLVFQNESGVRVPGIKVRGSHGLNNKPILTSAANGEWTFDTNELSSVNATIAFSGSATGYELEPAELDVARLVAQGITRRTILARPSSTPHVLISWLVRRATDGSPLAGLPVALVNPYEPMCQARITDPSGYVLWAVKRRTGACDDTSPTRSWFTVVPSEGAERCSVFSAPRAYGHKSCPIAGDDETGSSSAQCTQVARPARDLTTQYTINVTVAGTSNGLASVELYGNSRFNTLTNRFTDGAGSFSFRMGSIVGATASSSVNIVPVRSGYEFVPRQIDTNDCLLSGANTYTCELQAIRSPVGQGVIQARATQGGRGLSGVSIVQPDQMGCVSNIAKFTDGNGELVIPVRRQSTCNDSDTGRANDRLFLFPSLVGKTFSSSSDFKFCPMAATTAADFTAVDSNVVPQELSVRGRVLNLAGQAFAGVQIRLNGDVATTTDANGQFSIGRISQGTTVRLEASSPPYSFDPEFETFMEIGSDVETVIKAVAPDPLGGGIDPPDKGCPVKDKYTVSGTVRDLAGLPLAGAEIHNNNSEEPITTTDSEGRYSFEVGFGEDQWITVEHPGALFSPAGRALPWMVCDEDEVDFLQVEFESVLVGGRVVDSNGVPMKLIPMRVKVNGFEQSYPIQSGADGAFQFSAPLGASVFVSPEIGGYEFMPPYFGPEELEESLENLLFQADRSSLPTPTPNPTPVVTLTPDATPTALWTSAPVLPPAPGLPTFTPPAVAPSPTKTITPSPTLTSTPTKTPASWARRLGCYSYEVLDRGSSGLKHRGYEPIRVLPDGRVYVRYVGPSMEGSFFLYNGLARQVLSNRYAPVDLGADGTHYYSVPGATPGSVRPQIARLPSVLPEMFQPSDLSLSTSLEVADVNSEGLIVGSADEVNFVADPALGTLTTIQVPADLTGGRSLLALDITDNGKVLLMGAEARDSGAQEYSNPRLYIWEMSTGKATEVELPRQISYSSVGEIYPSNLNTFLPTRQMPLDFVMNDSGMIAGNTRSYPQYGVTTGFFRDTDGTFYELPLGPLDRDMWVAGISEGGIVYGGVRRWISGQSTGGNDLDWVGFLWTKEDGVRYVNDLAVDEFYSLPGVVTHVEDVTGAVVGMGASFAQHNLALWEPVAYVLRPTADCTARSTPEPSPSPTATATYTPYVPSSDLDACADSDGTPAFRDDFERGARDTWVYFNKGASPEDPAKRYLVYQSRAGAQDKIGIRNGGVELDLPRPARFGSETFFAGGAGALYQLGDGKVQIDFDMPFNVDERAGAKFSVALKGYDGPSQPVAGTQFELECGAVPGRSDLCGVALTPTVEMSQRVLVAPEDANRDGRWRGSLRIKSKRDAIHGCLVDEAGRKIQIGGTIFKRLAYGYVSVRTSAPGRTDNLTMWGDLRLAVPPTATPIFTAPPAATSAPTPSRTVAPTATSVPTITSTPLRTPTRSSTPPQAPTETATAAPTQTATPTSTPLVLPEINIRPLCIDPAPYHWYIENVGVMPLDGRWEVLRPKQDDPLYMEGAWQGEIKLAPGEINWNFNTPSMGYWGASYQVEISMMDPATGRKISLAVATWDRSNCIAPQPTPAPTATASPEPSSPPEFEPTSTPIPEPTQPIGPQPTGAPDQPTAIPSPTATESAPPVSTPLVTATATPTSEPTFVVQTSLRHWMNGRRMTVPLWRALSNAGAHLYIRGKAGTDYYQEIPLSSFDPNGFRLSTSVGRGVFTIGLGGPVRVKSVFNRTSATYTCAVGVGARSSPGCTNLLFAVQMRGR